MIFTVVLLTGEKVKNMGVSIRVAREKKPQLQHRPFTEREKELNKMSRRDMLKEWQLHADPYKMKAMKEFPNGKSNPFHYMSIYKIQETLKVIEASDEPLYKKENESIRTVIEFVTVFKDLLHVTTSEAVAIHMIFKDKLEDWIRENKPEKDSDISDKLLADLAYEAISEFRSDWEKAMANLEGLWRK